MFKNQKNKNYHLIIAQPRVGSNFLLDSLNSSPEIINFGEFINTWCVPYKAYKLFNPVKGNKKHFNEVDYFKWIYKNNRILFYLWQTSLLKNSYLLNKKYGAEGSHYVKKEYKNVKTIGLKDHYKKLQDFLPQILLKNNSYSIIVLYRENLLQRYISTRHACSTQKWFTHSNEYSQSVNKLIVNINEMFNYFYRQERLLSQMSELLSQYKGDIFKLTYEELFRNEESTKKIIENIFDFLGVKKESISISDQKKMLPKKLADKIENYEDIVNALKKTKYEYYLD